MAQLPPTRLFDPASDSAQLATIARIHADCITHDGQPASLLPPLTDDKLTGYWAKQASRIASGEMAMVVQWAADEQTGREEIAGYVCLVMPSSETGPFRGVVEKLMVSPRHRRKGVARRVMEGLERLAREKERFLLLLDTGVGLPAEKIYPRLGYKDCGVVPKYAISPATGELLDERFFYKDLRDEGT